jgi:acyl carrier protein
MAEMSRTEITARVRGILAHQGDCKIEDVKVTAPLARLFRSRMGFVSAVAVVEDAFEIEIDSVLLDEAATVGQLVDFVEGAVNR